MNWELEKNCDSTFVKIKKFNSTYYRIEALVQFNKKTIKTYFAASSGKKRKDFKNFDADNLKRDGGMKALIWMKSEMLDFYSFLNNEYRCDEGNKCIIYIGWADTRRKNVYSRLLSEGFYFMKDEGYNYLVKNIELPKNDS